MKIMKLCLSVFACLILLGISCSLSNGGQESEGITQKLTIFFVNDQHSQIDNFPKIKHIIDQEKQVTKVIVACSGDIFSGNPVVDNYPEKGYPMIDVMNKVGFDICTYGNHEFDYGPEVLKERIEQSEFDWVCANLDVNDTGVPEPFDYTTITVDDLKATFLGLIETNGKPNATIPATHPWKVADFTFHRAEDIIHQYSNVKKDEDADLYVALTHLGHAGSYGGVLGDFELANNYPYFDLIIGGHSSRLIDTMMNNIPIFQAGRNLTYLGKIKLKIKNKKVISSDFELIDLDNYPNFDPELKTVIDQYNAMPGLDDVLGYSSIHHSRNYNLGCFFTDALRIQMDVDLTFQNGGGIRADLDQGDITKREIYSMSPFNNGTIIYTMTVGEIKTFLRESGSGFYFSGLDFHQSEQDLIVLNSNGEAMKDHTEVSVGIIDYIPAVHDMYFPSSGAIQPFTDAETIINYLNETSEPVNYAGCSRYFRFQ